MKKNTDTRPFVVQLLYKVLNLVGVQFAARAFALTLIIFCSALLFSYISPSAGEAWIYNVTLFSGILTAGALGLIAATGIGLAVNLSALMSGAGIRYAAAEIKAARQSDQSRALPVGNKIFWGSDIVLVQWPDESGTDYANRVEKEIEALKSGAWIVCIKWRFDFIVVHSAKDSECASINRNAFLNEEKSFGNETEADFSDYISDTATPFSSYSNTTKMSDSKKRPVNEFLNIARATACVSFLFLSLSCSLFGQNTDKIKQSLVSDFVPRAESVVHYVFSDGSAVTRTADGKKTVSKLFASGYALAESRSVGSVLGIDTNGVAIVKKTAQATSAQPKPLFDGEEDRRINMPDSATISNALRDVANRLPFYKSKMYGFFRPFVEFFSYLFLFISPLFAICLGFFNLVSRSARQNGNLGIMVQRQQIAFAAFAWWTSIFLVGSAYLGFTFWMFFWELHPALITVCCFGAFYPAKWLINRLTPNGEYQTTTTVTRQNGGGGHRQLGA